MISCQTAGGLQGCTIGSSNYASITTAYWQRKRLSTKGFDLLLYLFETLNGRGNVEISRRHSQLRRRLLDRACRCVGYRGTADPAGQRSGLRAAVIGASNGAGHTCTAVNRDGMDADPHTPGHCRSPLECNRELSGLYTPGCDSPDGGRQYAQLRGAVRSGE